MAKHVNAWLDESTRSNVLSESRSLSEFDGLVRKCIEDGATDGFPEETLRRASGGALVAFIREAIVRSAGG
jgi:hypothetical protein